MELVANPVRFIPVFFFARPIAPDDQFVLEWDVRDASEVTISPGVGAVPAVGQGRVRASGTTRFTLTATTCFGAVTSEAVVVTPVARTVLIPVAQRTKLGARTALNVNRAGLGRRP